MDYFIARHRKLTTVYNDLRKDPRWRGIGDYPLLHGICHKLKEKGVKITLNDCAEALRDCVDGEFKRTTAKSEITLYLHKA